MERRSRLMAIEFVIGESFYGKRAAWDATAGEAVAFDDLFLR